MVLKRSGSLKLPCRVRKKERPLISMDNVKFKMKKNFLSSVYQFYIFNFAFLIFISCSIQKKISKSAQLVLKDSALSTAHVGISIYEACLLYTYDVADEWSWL